MLPTIESLIWVVILNEIQSVMHKARKAPAHKFFRLARARVGVYYIFVDRLQLRRKLGFTEATSPT